MQQSMHNKLKQPNYLKCFFPQKVCEFFYGCVKKVQTITLETVKLYSLISLMRFNKDTPLNSMRFHFL